ncbi:uncharacterized protein LOC125296179 [Alosa alosa]|uniref:uncharacterized protein LOC125296179 n=1 Tax=Alosa alosa TaxID=278164 RepID=UPI00201552E6|nr:uncharacterized protein LOC125296179 [Alosa alosa]
MRRKTIAKRIIGCEYEEQHQNYEETDTEISRSIVPCVLGGLQACSEADLITMVLSMHREMDNLREQIRCLTACGKLAQNLERLMETTDFWLNNTTRATSPSLRTFEGRDVPTVYTSSFVANGRLAQMETANHHQGVQIGANDVDPEENTPPLFQDFITTDLLERCNTGTTAQKLTNDLLCGLYERDYLASHSISGIVNNNRGQPKPALPAHEVQAILRAVKYCFPGKTDSEIKGYIRQKLQNEAKRLLKKHHPATPAPAASTRGVGSEIPSA